MIEVEMKHFFLDLPPLSNESQAGKKIEQQARLLKRVDASPTQPLVHLSPSSSTLIHPPPTYMTTTMMLMGSLLIV
jgi:hypothetical protein